MQLICSNIHLIHEIRLIGFRLMVRLLKKCSKICKLHSYPNKFMLFAVLILRRLSLKVCNEKH